MLQNYKTSKTVKALEENIEENLMTMGLTMIFRYTKSLGDKITGLHQKILIPTSKHTIKLEKSAHKIRRKCLQIIYLNKGLILRIYIF